MSFDKKELMRTVKFTLFSISAGVIEAVSFTLFDEVFHLNYWTAYLIALILSVLWNFTLNRKITFHSANNIPIAMLKVAGYYAVFTPLSTIWTAYLTSDKIGINEYVVLAGTMIINFVTEYLFQRFAVFGRSIDTAKGKQKAGSQK
ncbi:MAG: GtrA family protein [Clostridia bacterium]|nr:GtrA family protein [Clostridia bacterium]